MNDKNEVETLVLNNFSFLQSDFRFKKPKLCRDRWNTTISYLHDEIGIEVELDWRDNDVFVLVTKLDDGKLPKGYYVSNGKICRVHIEEVLQKSLGVEKEKIQQLMQFDNINQKKNQLNDFGTKIKRYQVLLHKYIGVIIRVGDNLFQYCPVNS